MEKIAGLVPPHPMLEIKPSHVSATDLVHIHRSGSGRSTTYRTDAGVSRLNTYRLSAILNKSEDLGSMRRLKGFSSRR